MELFSYQSVIVTYKYGFVVNSSMVFKFGSLMHVYRWIVYNFSLVDCL